MIFQVCYVLVCTTFLTHISLALTFEISNIVSTSNLLSSDQLIEQSCSLDDGPALKNQKCDSDVEREEELADLDSCFVSSHVF